MGIIGGGVSGLSAANEWLRIHPENKVILFEGRSDLGGWCKTDTNGLISMEQGARVLKNDDAALDFYELCYHASTQEKDHLNLLVGSNPKCRESFLADLAAEEQSICEFT